MAGHAYPSAVPASKLSGDRTPGARSALLVAAACLVGLALVWALAELVPAGQAKDAVVLREFVHLGSPGLDFVARSLADLLEPEVFVIWAVVILYVALARGRPSLALAAALVMAFAPLTSELLKPLLAHPRSIGTWTVPANSWPSGHSTAALTLALCAVLVAPARMRAKVAVIGALFAAAVGCSLLILARHMPSDVLGGYLVATFWMAIAVTALRTHGRAEPRWVF
jgi:membrane-associated phospholipid phosphatase